MFEKAKKSLELYSFIDGFNENIFNWKAFIDENGQFVLFRYFIFGGLNEAVSYITASLEGINDLSISRGLKDIIKYLN